MSTRKKALMDLVRERMLEFDGVEKLNDIDRARNGIDSMSEAARSILRASHNRYPIQDIGR